MLFDILTFDGYRAQTIPARDVESAAKYARRYMGVRAKAIPSKHEAAESLLQYASRFDQRALALALDYRDPFIARSGALGRVEMQAWADVWQERWTLSPSAAWYSDAQVQRELDGRRQSLYGALRANGYHLLSRDGAECVVQIRQQLCD